MTPSPLQLWSSRTHSKKPKRNSRNINHDHFLLQMASCHGDDSNNDGDYGTSAAAHLPVQCDDSDNNFMKRVPHIDKERPDSSHSLSQNDASDDAFMPRAPHKYLEPPRDPAKDHQPTNMEIDTDFIACQNICYSVCDITMDKPQPTSIYFVPDFTFSAPRPTCITEGKHMPYQEPDSNSWLLPSTSLALWVVITSATVWGPAS